MNLKAQFSFLEQVCKKNFDDTMPAGNVVDRIFDKLKAWVNKCYSFTSNEEFKDSVFYLPKLRKTALEYVSGTMLHGEL